MMKNATQFIFTNVLLFIIFTVGITCFYTSTHLLTDFSEIKSQSVLDIFIQIGCLGALIPMIFFSLINLCVKKIQNKLAVYFIIILLSVLFIIAVYQFILYMTFHEFSIPIQFYQIGNWKSN